MTTKVEHTLAVVADSVGGGYSATFLPHVSPIGGATHGERFVNFNQCAQFLRGEGVSESAIEKLKATGRLEATVMLPVPQTNT